MDDTTKAVVGAFKVIGIIFCLLLIGIIITKCSLDTPVEVSKYTIKLLSVEEIKGRKNELEGFLCKTNTGEVITLNNVDELVRSTELKIEKITYKNMPKWNVPKIFFDETYTKTILYY